MKSLITSKIKVIAFDADDTLWENEQYFRETEARFCSLLEDFMPAHSINRELYAIEIKNLFWYGYGIKSFMLSMIETAIKVSDGKIGVLAIDRIMQLGNELLAKPVLLLEGVEETLKTIEGKFKLVVATKGDLLDQERKLEKSGLAKYFHHVEIVSEKRESDYKKLLKHLDVLPEEFLMVGNSIKSDILPVLNLGAFGFHIPYHITWEHEKIDIEIDNPNFRELQSIREVAEILL
ncbi:MAG: HAD family hydrolase [Cyclobacteriaceae bacterium]|nr:HAD family hydrolase [Cyclobacteriaceae bacterium]